MKEGISRGTYPYMWSWHTVWIGMRDTLAYWEVDDQKRSLIRAIREDKGDMVLIQEEGSFWEPTAVKTSPNDKRIYVNNSALQEEGVATAENYLPAIISGAYKANNILINCKDIPLFSDYIIDNEWWPQTGIDLSATRHLVRHAVDLRTQTHENSEKLNIILIVPEYTRQKAYEGEGDNLVSTIENNFNRDGEDYNISYISREQIFIDMLVRKIQENSLHEKMIYIDTEGSDIIWAERCKSMLIERLWCNENMVITNPKLLEENKDKEKIAILLRSWNRMIWASWRHSIKNRWVSHVFYPQTSREDLVRHDNNDDAWRRIPVPYNSDIWSKVLAKLT